MGVASCPIYLKADVLESCARFSPFGGVCPVVELTGLGSLCLSKSGEVPRMCVGANVESCEKSCMGVSEKFL